MRKTAELDKCDWIAGLEKGLRIIEAFNDAHPRLSPSTAARRTSITRTAARRYLRTLHHLGYLESDGKLYWLTPRILRLGWSYFDSARVTRAVQPYLQRISVALGGATYFVVFDDDDVVFVARDGSSMVKNVGFVLGARISASLSTAGVVLLSCRSVKEVDRWLRGRKFVPYTPHTAITPEAVRKFDRHGAGERLCGARAAAGDAGARRRRSGPQSRRRHPGSDQREPSDGQRDQGSRRGARPARAA